MNLPTFIDKRGTVTVWDNAVPFNVKRVFWIYNVPKGEARGNHYVRCEQFIVALKGFFFVNGQMLDNPANGLYIPRGTFVRLDLFSPDAVCLVLCSDHYQIS